MITIEKLLFHVLILTLFYIWYRWNHRWENDYQTKRILLLVIWVVALIIPFVNWQIIPVNVVSESLSNGTRISPQNGLSSAGYDNAISFLGSVYLSGVIVYLMYITLSVVLVFYRFKKYAFSPYLKDFKIYQSDGSHSYSFLHFIVLRKEANNLERLHEEGHVIFGHTWDLIIAEILTGLSWFNPIAYFMKKMIIENHEFQADDYAIKMLNMAPVQYAENLYNTILEKGTNPVIHPFKSQVNARINHLQIKQNPKMMKYLFSLLFLIIVSSAFTIKTYPRTMSLNGDQFIQPSDSIIIKDTIIVFDFDKKVEKMEIVETKMSLEDYMKEINLSGKMIEIIDTMITFDVDNQMETKMEKIQVIPIELEKIYENLPAFKQAELVKKYGKINQKKIDN